LDELLKGIIQSEYFLVLDPHVEVETNSILSLYGAAQALRENGVDPLAISGNILSEAGDVYRQDFMGHIKAAVSGLTISMDSLLTDLNNADAEESGGDLPKLQNSQPLDQIPSPFFMLFNRGWTFGDAGGLSQNPLSSILPLVSAEAFVHTNDSYVFLSRGSVV